MSEQFCIDVEGIMQRIPHRHPFLLIDGIVSIEPGRSVAAVKNVTATEAHFAGHFPQHPVMPGVLILEAMAQAAGVLVWESVEPASRNFILYLAGVESARFRKPAQPGDRIDIHVELAVRRRNLWRFNAQAKVGDTLIASAEMTQAPGRYL
jgi:3-hydroxyacyl-[acyl-carrier-protein] dehydratase